MWSNSRFVEQLLKESISLFSRDFLSDNFRNIIMPHVLFRRFLYLHRCICTKLELYQNLVWIQTELVRNKILDVSRSRDSRTTPFNFIQCKTKKCWNVIFEIESPKPVFSTSYFQANPVYFDDQVAQFFST